MKKFLFSIGAFFICSFAISQVKIGLQGGMISSKVKAISDLSGLSYQSKLGFNAGLLVGVDIGESGFSVLTELNYVSKGYQFSGVQPGGISLEGVQRINYIEMPANLLYYVSFRKSYFFLGGGPYGAVAVSGMRKTTYTSSNHSEISEEPADFGNQPEQLKRLEYGLNALIGYKLGIGSYIKLHYSHGLANFSNTNVADLKSRYFGLTFGYFFGYLGKEKGAIIKTIVY